MGDNTRGELFDDVLGFDPPPKASQNLPEIPTPPPNVEEVDVRGQKDLTRKTAKNRKGRQSTKLSLFDKKPQSKLMKNKKLG